MTSTRAATVLNAPETAGHEELLTLRAGAAMVEVAPQHGCLISVLDPGGGRNLLWRDGRSARTLTGSDLVGDASGTDFDDNTLVGGWFPMFPNAGLATAETQQHGWAPRVAWSILRQGRGWVVCQAEGAFLNGGSAVLRRAIRVTEFALEVRTTVENAGATAGEFTWGEHPCFSGEVFAGGCALFAGEVVRRIPLAPDGAEGHEARIGPAPATLHGPGVSIELTDLAGTQPYWLMWFNHRAPVLPRADTIAWETSNAPGLGLTDARAAGRTQILKPGGVAMSIIRCRWTLSTTD